MIQREKYYEYNFYYDDVLIKTSFQSNWIKFTYHYIYLDRSQNRPNNDAYGFGQYIGETNINETMEAKYYEYNFYYDDGSINTFYQLDLKKSLSTLFPVIFHNCWNNETYEFEQ